MYIIRVALFLAVAAIGSSCENNDKVINDERACCGDSPSWMNKWRLVETGYSPGGDYIINEVPASANQYLTLRQDGTVSTTIEGFDAYRYFTIKEDAGRVVLSFFQQDSTAAKPDELFHVRLENGKLKLFNPKCIEGCHMGFVATN